jgi:hypothetical protein
VSNILEKALWSPNDFFETKKVGAPGQVNAKPLC